MSTWHDFSDDELAARLALRVDRIRNSRGQPWLTADSIRRAVDRRDDPDIAELIDALLGDT